MSDEDGRDCLVLPHALDALATEVASLTQENEQIKSRHAEDKESLLYVWHQEEARVRELQAAYGELRQERELLLDHLDAARQAIADAQQWSDKWKNHAFQEQAKVTELRQENECLKAEVRRLNASR